MKLLSLLYPFFKTNTPRKIYKINNQLYWWTGWFGCQLESYEWRRVPAGTTRTLNLEDSKGPIDFRVFTTERDGLKYRTTWSMVGNCGDINEENSRIHELRKRLSELY